MPKTRSLIEQAVLDAFDKSAARRPSGDIASITLGMIHRAMVQQIADEAVQRDARYRIEARNVLYPLDAPVRVEPDALVEHAEVNGSAGAWIGAKVFVLAADVKDE